MPEREVKLSLDIAVLRESLGLSEEELPDDATDEQVNEAILTQKASADPVVGDDDDDDEKGKKKKATKKEPDKKPDPVKSNVPGGVTVDQEQWAAVNNELAVVRTEREAREKKEDIEYLQKASRGGKIPPPRIDHYMKLMKADRPGTREFIDGLAQSLPVQEVGSLGDLDDALKASDYEESWLSPGERRRIETARAAYADGRVGDVEPGTIIREA